MNPKCQRDLYEGDKYVGEMAHIVPHADGGSISIENLIVLCRNCHKIAADTSDEATVDKLRSWKSSRNTEIKKLLSQRVDSFAELAQIVTPLLARNSSIFRAYGPSNDTSYEPTKKLALWKRFESELVANNKKLELVFLANSHLFHGENWSIIEDFIHHTEEFIATRDNAIERIKLFPQPLPAMFGIDEFIDRKPPPSVSALQNLVKQLVAEGAFVELQFAPKSRLVIRDNDSIESIDLSNRPRLQQLYWSRRCFKPKTTELRLEKLIYFVKWLHYKRIAHEFDDMRDLTTMTVARGYRLNLFYEYILSLDDLFWIDPHPKLIALNLYDWNGGRITDEAREHAATVGFLAMTQNEFFRFALRELK